MEQWIGRRDGRGETLMPAAASHYFRQSVRNNVGVGVAQLL